MAFTLVVVHVGIDDDDLNARAGVVPSRTARVALHGGAVAIRGDKAIYCDCPSQGDWVKSAVDEILCVADDWSDAYAVLLASAECAAACGEARRSTPPLDSLD